MSFNDFPHIGSFYERHIKSTGVLGSIGRSHVFCNPSKNFKPDQLTVDNE